MLILGYRSLAGGVAGGGAGGDGGERGVEHPARLGAHLVGLEAADRVLGDRQRQVGHAARLALQLGERLELVGADDDGGQALFLEDDGGLDTPGRAGASIGAADKDEVGLLLEDAYGLR